MKAYGRDLAVGRDHDTLFCLCGNHPKSHWLQGWVGPRAGLDALAMAVALAGMQTPVR
jgi:hypothetical protein